MQDSHSLTVTVAASDEIILMEVLNL